MYFDNNRHIDEYFRNHLKDYSQVPDDNVWEKIDSRLSYESKMRRIFVFRTAAIAIIILGLSVFLAREVSYFNPADSRISSATWEKELSMYTNIHETTQYTRIDDSRDVTSSVKNEVPDIQIPDNVLFKRSRQNSNNHLPENASLDEQNFAKLTALKEPLKHKEEDNPYDARLNQSVSDNYYFSEQKPGQFHDITFSTEPDKKSRFSLSGSFSPILSYRNSNIKQASNNLPAENSLLSYSGGMDVSYNLFEKLTFRTGMHYTKFGQSLNNVEVTSGSYAMKDGNTIVNIASSMGEGQVQFKDLLEAQQYGESAGFITLDGRRPPEFTVESAIYQTFEMVKMPFLFEYTFLNDKFNFSMIGGLNANLLVNEGIYMEHTQKTKQIGSTKNLNSISYSGTLGVGFKYDITSKAQVFMEPTFDYYITSLTSDDSYQTFPYFFGFFSGVSISF
jgi:hypothetical protein